MSVPMSLKAILDIIKTSGGFGEVEFPLFGLTFLAPAASVTTFTMNTPDGFVVSFNTPLNVYTSLADPNLTALVYVDDNKLVTPVPFTLATAGPIEVSMGQYYVSYKNLIIVIINGTAFDAAITGVIEDVMMQKSFFEQWYQPLLQYNWKTLNDIVKSMGGVPRR